MKTSESKEEPISEMKKKSIKKSNSIEKSRRDSLALSFLAKIIKTLLHSWIRTPELLPPRRPEH